MNTIDLFPIQEETLSFDEFVKLFESNRVIIDKTAIEPADIDGDGFGGIRVRYKYPIYKYSYGEQFTAKTE